MNRLKSNFVVKEEEDLRVHIEGEEGVILEYDVNDGVRIIDANNTPRIEFIDTDQDKRRRILGVSWQRAVRRSA